MNRLWRVLKTRRRKSLTPTGRSGSRTISSASTLRVGLIDGVDGLASGVCVIAGTTLAVIALSLDRDEAGVGHPGAVVPGLHLAQLVGPHLGKRGLVRRNPHPTDRRSEAFLT